LDSSPRYGEAGELNDRAVPFGKISASFKMTTITILSFQRSENPCG
jgi:hypothetical protein